MSRDVRWIPSPTITAGPGGKGSPRNVTGGAHARRLIAAAKAEWAHERPATTIVSAFGAGKVAPPGHHTTSTYEAEESVAITVEEASILQSFRPDYPWQGSKTKKFEQIGNAIPPVLAASILAALLEIQP